MVQFLPTRTQERQADISAQYIRNDELHLAKSVPNTVFRKMLLGIAEEELRFRAKTDEVYNDYDPRVTTNLIEEWEKTVGIPDDCLTNTGTLQERRDQVLFKLTSFNVTTKQQFEAVATALGITVVIRSGGDPGIGVFPLDFPITFLPDGAPQFTIIADLPIALQSNPISNTLLCLYNRLKPANTEVLLRFIP